MIFLFLALNLAVSWLNCYMLGGIWAESKAVGGFSRVLAWCGAVQSAVGFSSVIGAVMGYALFVTGHLPPKVAAGAVSLWYLLVIIPVIGTGLLITIQSWIVACRERSLLSMGAAAYNTFAQLHNMYGALDGIPEGLGAVGKLFDSKDKDSAPVLLAIVLVVVALGGGILLTALLIRKYAGRLPLPERDAPLVAGHA
ncbi:hypothetical protein [Burkholderia anthina]|uniref:hypothetical protein n=1 Tax=Burkholderia anthina TaxID=179879 RepID=UPI0015884FE4|nr:hypothetical protein [Burkholderia anthina]